MHERGATTTNDERYSMGRLSRAKLSLRSKWPIPRLRICVHLSHRCGTGMAAWYSCLVVLPCKVSARRQDQPASTVSTAKGKTRGTGRQVTGGNPNVNRSDGSSTNARRGAADQARKINRRHGSWVLIMFGTTALFGSVAQFFGVGCVYDMDDIRGQIGDAFSKFKIHTYIYICY
jgi:hypothetical protein